MNTLVGGQKEGAKGFMFFIINVDLTEEGLCKYSVHFTFQSQSESTQTFLFASQVHLRVSTRNLTLKDICSTAQAYKVRLYNMLHKYHKTQFTVNTNGGQQKSKRKILGSGTSVDLKKSFFSGLVH